MFMNGVLTGVVNIDPPLKRIRRDQNQVYFECYVVVGGQAMPMHVVLFTVRVKDLMSEIIFLVFELFFPHSILGVHIVYY